MGYPWDLMDSVREETPKPHGLDLVYSEPPISKEEWLRFVKNEG
jgi:hypothetical protein